MSDGRGTEPVARARPIIDGHASGPIMRVDHLLSFWGDVDPATGLVTDPRSPRHGDSVAGTILVVPGTRGSSSSSAVMLELLARGRAPAALVLGRVDAIVALGILVAREMGYPTIPLLELAPGEQRALVDGVVARVERGGAIALVSRTA